MPSPFVLPAPSRRVRRLGVLGLLVLMALALLLTRPAQSSAAPAPEPGAPPAAPADPAAPGKNSDDSPVDFDLVELGPTALEPGATLTATVKVTNTSSDPIPDPSLDLRTRTPRVTDRSALDTWESDTRAHEIGTTIGTKELGEELAPGESRDVRYAVSADDLGYSPDASFWGARRIAFTLTGDGGQELATLRSFVVWWPEGVTDTIDQSVLLPIAAEDPGQAALNPEAYGKSAESGRLAALGTLAQRTDVDWLLDPAVLDPPSHRYEKSAQGGGSPASDKGGSASPEARPEIAYAPEKRAEAFATTLTENASGRSVLTLPYAGADLASLHEARTNDLRRTLEERSRSVLSDAEIESAGTTVPTAAGAADPETITDTRAGGAQVLIIPTTSLVDDPNASVTPSGAATLTSGKGENEKKTPVLAPDSALTGEFSDLTADGDNERTRQRLLAETAVIAEDPTETRRQVLIAPDPSVTLDAEAAGGVLDAFGEAPWLHQEPTQTLLQTAEEQDWTTNSQAGKDSTYAIGERPASAVSPSVRDADGGWKRTESAQVPGSLAKGDLRRLQSLSGRLDSLATVTADDTVLESTRLTLLSGASSSWRGGAPEPDQRAARAEKELDEDFAEITVETASGYNLVADSAGVPITISNNLDSAIVVQPEVTVDNDIVRLEKTHEVKVPAHGSTEVTVPVQAIANGKVTLTASVAGPDGTVLTSPQTTTLSVNPAWENWTTLVLVIAMGLLVVVGVLRARRVGSDRRAPAPRPGDEE